MSSDSLTGVRTRLDAGFLGEIDRSLKDTDELLQAAYPGPAAGRQPVHTVYVPADRYTASLPAEWGRAAIDLVDAHGGLAAVAALIGLSPELAEEVSPRVAAKLEREPIEDLRLDFEDGYGVRADAIEDADAVAVAGRLAAAFRDGTAPPFAGLRFKCFEAPTRRRGIATFELFVATLLAELDELPTGLVITFPKVSTVDQVRAMVKVCAELESTYGLPAGRLGFEIQVETPQLILGADGTAAIAKAIHVGDGRVTSLHYGTYDYSASLQISAAYQTADHPAADYAKQVMQVAVAGTAVALSDGSTNILPLGDPAQVAAAWRIHADLVTRALQRGFYQGWDLHPGQLPTRYLATFAFYRAGLPQAARRLRNYLGRVESEIMDEPATARALARFLHRGLSCGAVDETELTRLVGLTGPALAALSLPRSDTEGAAAPAPPAGTEPAPTRRSAT
ncbi:MAG: DUF6986 family protein [Propionibacteriaceae bacterium]